METGIVASIVTTLLSPLISKFGEKISEKFGEDIYPIIKPLFIEEEEKTLEKVIKNPSSTERASFQVALSEKLEQKSDVKELLLEKLNFTSSKGMEVERIIKTMKKIQNNIEEYSDMLESAGVGTTGDVYVVLQNDKRKYEKLYSELLKTLNK